ncbi:MAG: branched-chain amino acid ABC transporter permease [Pseudanabaenaceae cyanobacterium]
MLEIVQALIDGVAVGSVLSLGAMGLTLVYGILRLCNFAHGDLLSLGAYIAFACNVGLGWEIWLAMLVGIGGTAIVSLVCDWLLWTPLRKQKATNTTLMIASIGLAYVLRNGIILVWGASPLRYSLPTFPPINIGEIALRRNQVVVIVTAVVAILIVGFILKNTKIGKAMRAVADSPELAKITGIDVNLTIFWTWVIAITLTALGGAMYGLITNLRPNMGWLLMIPMFTAVIMGGIGNPYGAIVGALVVGIAQELVTTCPQFLGENRQYCIPTDYKLGVSLLFMIIILLYRPQGIFGRK